MRYNELVAILVCALLLGCSSETRTSEEDSNNVEQDVVEDDTRESEPDPNVVAPGTKSQALGSLRYRPSVQDSHCEDCPPKVYSACTQSQSASSLAVVEIVEIGEVFRPSCEDTGPFGQAYIEAEVDTLAVAGGRELPRSFVLTQFGNQAPIEVGTRWLLGVREVDEHLVYMTYLQLDHGGNAIPAPRDELYRMELPSSFEELVEEAEPIFEDFYRACDGVHRSDEQMRRRIYKEYECREPVPDEDPEPEDPCDGDPDCE